MDKEKLKKCRFYHGEASCPYPDRSSIFFWMCEREWCNHAGDYSKEIKDLKDAHFDDFAIDEYGGERAPVSLLSLIYAKARKGWQLLRLVRLYFGLDKAGSYAIVEAIPTHFVTHKGKTKEVEDDSWWQAFLKG